MLVCIDKVTCVRMHALITKHWQERLAELERELAAATEEQEEIYRRRQIDWMKETLAAVVVSEEQGEVDRFRKWDMDITPHRRLIKDGFAGADGKRIDMETAFKRDEPSIPHCNRLRHVADGLRRAQPGHAVSRQAAQGPHADAGHCPS